MNCYKYDVTKPPITAELTIEDLKSIAENRSIKDLQNYKFPCHTQSVESCVKLVTEAASVICGSQNKYGFIRNTMASMAVMPSFEQKANYKMMQFTA
ncbi:hypothetical protein AVEN_225927-1 [Araneus ventricosus]|uniref:Uncharacterized protein n=1 Tax=Araneus ventricosus TaxID=182803 RepID=A0A4Y2BD54_ARAVE|nr:hypothetical protein AVEN_225927-1 [Araneus ventricosus]